MARQNYSHGKRLRELAKKQKREEKMQRRLERKAGVGANPSEETVVEGDLQSTEGGLEATEGDLQGAEGTEQGASADEPSAGADTESAASAGS